MKSGVGAQTFRHSTKEAAEGSLSSRSVCYRELQTVRAVQIDPLYQKTKEEQGHGGAHL